VSKKPSPQRHEYTTTSTTEERLQQILQEMSEEGWRLVSACYLAHGHFQLFFERSTVKF
jgi:hypothetical protein